MRRPGRMPEARQRLDVPELHGDARGAAQHARPCAHAVRAAPGRGRPQRLAGRSTSSGRSICACRARRASPNVPTNVDIATYRAEFLSHYYERQHAHSMPYAFGMVDRWLQFASVAPRAANLFMQTPGLVTAARRALHLAPERELPRLAPVSFRTWARREGIAHVGRSAPARATPASGNVALLWIDTFNNHFHPETTQAGIEVLRAAGFQPVVPARRLCCGRPLYDFWHALITPEPIFRTS